MSNKLDLKKALSCNFCQEILEEPVFLPCSESTCLKHIEAMKTFDIINCHFCNEQHIIPEMGFPKDIRMAQLIANDFHKIDFGEAHKKALNSCKELEKMIDKMQSLTENPETFINEYYDKIINEIDIFREENKLIIDKWHENCFNDIQKYKNECLANLKKEFTAQNQNIKKFESYLDFWQQKLKIPELSKKMYSFSSINSNVDSSSLALERIYEGLKNDLLLGKQYKLKTSKNVSIEDFAKIKFDKKVNFQI